MVAAYLKSNYILLTDAHISDIVIQNIEQIPSSLQDKIKTFKFNWDNQNVPEILIRPTTNSHWDTILCSDVLYEQELLLGLITFLKSIQFKKIILSYKMRHYEKEKTFFTFLFDCCHVYIINNDSIHLINITKKRTEGLFVIIAIPKQ